MKKPSPTSRRKDQHLEICLEQDVQAQIPRSPWDEIPLPHRALPELDMSEIDLTTSFLGRTYAAPILISSMTGGTDRADRLNETLARFAQEKNIPMGLGSQRIWIEEPERVKKWKLRKIAPKAALFANLGVVQLNYGVKIEDVQRLIENTQAQGIFLHLNPLQEAIQAEGNRNFASLLPKLSQLRKVIKVPMILKETGSGIDTVTARQVRDLGIDAIEISGMGGTHWGYIEGLRSKKRHDLGQLFASWGIPSPQALADLRATLGSDYPLLASGGLRSGLDLARAHYLGADFCGLALPFLKAASQGAKALEDFYAFLVEALRVSLFCTASKNPKELKLHGSKRKN